MIKISVAKKRGMTDGPAEVKKEDIPGHGRFAGHILNLHGPRPDMRVEMPKQQRFILVKMPPLAIMWDTDHTGRQKPDRFTDPDDKVNAVRAQTLHPAPMPIRRPLPSPQFTSQSFSLVRIFKVKRHSVRVARRRSQVAGRKIFTCGSVFFLPVTFVHFGEIFKGRLKSKPRSCT
jgi:hypothetical protein